MSFFSRKTLATGDALSVGPHEKQLRKYFDRFDLPQHTQTRFESACILLFMNRSGSSMVGEYMRATGQFSGFGEPFNHDLVIQRAQEHGIEDFHGYLKWLDEHIHRSGTTFGMKASTDQVAMLLNSGAIPTYFNDIKWAVVYRRDLLSQAVSYTIAEQTQQWHSFESSNDIEPRYDFDVIKDRLNIIHSAYQSMGQLCQMMNVEPYIIYYEDFIEQPIQATQAFATYLGSDSVQVKETRLKMRKQGNETNRLFKERFLADLDQRGRSEDATAAQLTL